MSFLWSVALCIISLVIVKISHWIYRWSNPKCTGKLPPGSMGFPVIGETVSFLKCYGLYDLPLYIKERMSRYGPLFRTNIVGLKTVVSTDMDVNLEILRQENKSFVIGYPGLSDKLLGEDNLMLKHGDFHKKLKHIALKFLGSENLKRNIIGDMDRITQEHLVSKAKSGRFDVKEVVSSLITASTTPKMMSNLKEETQTKLITVIKRFNSDWFQLYSIPFAVKSFFKALKARKDAMRMIIDVFKTRKASREKQEDFLETLLEDIEKDSNYLSQDSAANIIFALMYAAQESSSKAISLAVKFLCENPKVLTELKREHDEILESREDKSGGTTWDEYRYKMKFTAMVINETLRIMNFAPFVFRKAIKDVEIKGYTIPAGWNVLVFLMAVHFDPDVYENPLEFNPWRWEGKDVRSGSKTFVAFGGGMRQCVGSELARLQMAIFLHHLVTKYEFSKAKECDVIRTPVFLLPNGMHINISPLLNSSSILY